MTDTDRGRQSADTGVAMNPFEGKSLTELLDGVPGYADPELDALTGKYCDCMKIRFSCTGNAWQRWYFGRWIFLHRIDHLDYRPTTDWREAGRLLEKYHLEIGEVSGGKWQVGHNLYLISEGQEEPLARHDNPCRAITETAVTAALTKLIEKARHASD